MIRIIIAGCGFGGVESAINLHKLLKDEVEIIGIDKSDSFNFYPFWHRIAARTFSEDEARISLFDFFDKIDSIFFKEKIIKINPTKNEIVTERQKLSYDYLIIALGAETNYYNIPGAENNCFDLRSPKDALEISQHIARKFIHIRKNKKEKILRIVVCGGGATGVELATELKIYIERFCKKYGINPSEVEIVLIEALPKILPTFPEKCIAYAENKMKKMGIKLICGNPIAKVGKDFVLLKNGEKIYSETIIWCGGLRSSDIVRDSGLKVDEKGFVVVNDYLQPVLNGKFLENTYCVGDVLTFIRKETGLPVIKLARHAVHQAKIAARNIYADIEGKKKIKYIPKRETTIVSLGRKDAVGFYGKTILKGRIAIWLKYFIENRYLRRYL